jgi:hypothetical protein
MNPIRLNLNEIRKSPESIVGIIILCLLLLITIAVLIKQSRYDMASFGMVLSGGSAGKGISFERVVPDGFELMLKSEMYNRDNLHEKINGKATLYFESGFVEMMSQRYAAKSGRDIWMELFIYDMGEYKNAYSVFGQQKREDAKMIAGYDAACSTSNAFFAVIGKYYIEITGSTESAALLKAIMEAGDKIKGQLGSSPGDNMGKISIFDKNYMVPGSDKLNLKSAFGYADFKNVYTARYRLKDSVATAFMSDMNAPDDAKKISDGYHRFLLDNGGNLKKADSETGSKIIELYGSFEAVSSCGKFVFGVHEAENMKDAENISRILFNKLCKRAE